METLYLHCGYHKTGSSFLQMMFARNRELLKKASIYYPYSESELDMIEGNISPGNGRELSKSLRARSKAHTVHLLKNDIEEAQNNRCRSILYSSEELFHTFAKEDSLDGLCDAVRESGFQKIEAMVYFRDPVSHALSTYKHRAKNGNHSDIEGWIKNQYETMQLLSKFVGYHSKYPIKWTCRKYKADSDFMAESSFRDWLGLNVPKIPEDDNVNASLTLSEIRFIQILKEADFQAAVPYLQEAFGNIEKLDKSADKSLNGAYRSIMSRALEKYRDLINSVNCLLPEGEDLKLESGLDEDFPYPSELEITLKREQVKVIAEALFNTVDSHKMVRKAGNFWNKGIDKVRRKLKASGL